MPRASAAGGARVSAEPRPRPTTRASRYPRGSPPPVLVEVRRAGIVESRHRGHIVQVGPGGQVERGVGDPETAVTLRSAVKPFALVTLVESGAAGDFRLSAPELAVMAGSHAGEDQHVRTLQAVFRRAGLSQTLLACGARGAPLDPRTAARLARDGEEPGPIRHMCSGFHAVSLLLSRFAGWPLESYHLPDHPSQVAVRETVARLFGVRAAALRIGLDDCGLQTYVFPLVEVARAYALLADPAGAPDLGRAQSSPALTRVRDAMMSAPELVGGTGDFLDTILMKRCPGRLVAKAGGEALRGIGLLPAARPREGTAAGLALKIDDGDGHRRAGRAVTIEALAQLGTLDNRDLRALADEHRPVTRDAQRQIAAETVVGFELAPIGELVGGKSTSRA